MKPADFEESEYRGPLYNQLERGNHLVWEPGQVFEKHIGIDRAAYVTDPYFWSLHGFSHPMQGAVLIDYDWDYIWRKRVRNKILPDFQLNLFLQAKRPHAGTRPRANIKKEGITGNYWKFQITPHQQAALERMSKSISDRAIVCYASPAFHTQAALYEHTKNNSVVKFSTFPPVDALTDHGAWYYDNGGIFGVANPDFERVELTPLMDRIQTLTERIQRNDDGPGSSLISLAKAIVASQEEVVDAYPVDTWFQQLLQQVDNLMDNIINLGMEDERKIDKYRAFAQIKAFCTAYHSDWYVIGRGS